LVLNAGDFFDDFESASLGEVRKFGDRDFGIEVQSSLKYGHQGSLEVWFYGGVDLSRLKLSGDQMLKIRVPNEHHNLQFVRPVYSYDNVKWQMVPEWGLELTNGQLIYGFSLPMKPGADRLYFAACYPYTYTRMLETVERLRQFDYVQTAIIGKSAGGRDLYMLTVAEGDPADFHQRAFFTAGFHGGETSGLYGLEGVLNYLTSDAARGLRQRVAFGIVPMVNVDAQATGLDRRNANGINLWLDPNAIAEPEYVAVMDSIREFRPSVYLDYHSWHWAGNGGYAPPVILVGEPLHARITALRQHLNQHFPMTPQLLFAESPSCPAVYIARLLNIPTHVVEHSLSVATDGAYKTSPQIMRQDGVRALAGLIGYLGAWDGLQEESELLSALYDWLK
jgi:hypothetical protein